MRRPWLVPMVLWLVAMVAYVGLVLYFAQDMPDKVATHFNIAGKANGWMTRSGMVTFDLCMGIGMPVFIIGLMYSLRFIPGAAWNVPNKEVWMQPQNLKKAADFQFHSSFWLALMMTLFLTALNWQTWKANQMHPPTLPPQPVMIAAGVFLAGTLAWVVRVILFFSKVPKTETGPLPG